MSEETTQTEKDRILEELTYTRDKIRELFLQIKPTDHMLGIYIETDKGKGIKESGFLLGEKGNLKPHSLKRTYFTDETLTQEQLKNLQQLFDYFVEYTQNDVFTHSDKKNVLSKNPLWFALLWDEKGKYLWKESSFGYTFKNQEKFGNSDSGHPHNFQESNVYIWANYLNNKP